MRNREEILKKFIDKESKFQASKVLDEYVLSNKANCQVVTDFLTPSFLTELTDELEKKENEHDIFTFGGFNSAERRCIIFNKDEYNYFEIEVIKITTNTKYNKPLEHRAVLGSILGLGVTRNKIGDIIFDGDNCYVFLKSDIKDFIIFNLEYVGRSKVKVEESLYTVSEIDLDEKLKTATVSSLRIDTIISSVTKYSRSDVKKLFEKELVLVNWKVCKNSSTVAKELDVITVRRFGRIKIQHIRGISKKGKLIIDYY